MEEALDTRRCGDGVVWAFDVDGTLIGSVRSDVLRPGAAGLLEELCRRGTTCVLWSAGGEDYARRMAAQHGILHHFAACYAKGERDAGGHYRTSHFHGAHHPHVFVDDVPGDLPHDVIVIAVAQFIGGNPGDRALVALHHSLGTTPTEGGTV